MRLTIYFALAIFLTSFYQSGAAKYPQNYFVLPVSFPVKLTGTFGELRSNHFHSGIDIKSPNGRVGHTVLSAADGYVSRIKVQAGGYGNALYIKHPNGYTTVYAHLDGFSSELAEYVKNQQYKKEQFEVNLYPSKGIFSVKKGQKIGTLGNSGGSTGPHLHFEIRNSANDHPLNPLLFGLDVPDDVPPSIRGIKIYHLNDALHTIDHSRYDVRKISAGNYRLKMGDTIRVPAWRCAFSVKSYDSMSGFPNDNGAYKVSCSLNGAEEFSIKMEELDFDETRYLNAHIDFWAKKSSQGYYHRLFKLPGDLLNNYSTAGNQGIVTLYEHQPQKVEIRSMDADGNFAVLTFWVKRASNVGSSDRRTFNFLFPYNQENTLENSGLRLNMRSKTLYEDLFLEYATTPDYSYGTYSSVHHIHNDKTPIHRYFDIALREEVALPPDLRSKAYVGICDADAAPVSCGGTYKDGWVSTKVRELGNFCLLVDVDPPTVKKAVFDYDMSKKSEIAFIIKDNIETTGRARGLSYRATVDGKWILMEYDGKRDRISHTFDGRIGRGEHILRLVVTDDRNNETVFEQTFMR